MEEEIIYKDFEEFPEYGSGNLEKILLENSETLDIKVQDSEEVDKSINKNLEVSTCSYILGQTSWSNAYKAFIKYGIVGKTKRGLIPIFSETKEELEITEKDLPTYLTYNISTESLSWEYLPDSAWGEGLVYKYIGIESEIGGKVEYLDESTYFMKQGSTVKIKATPNTGYEFSSWKDLDGNIISTESTYSFIVGSEIELIANFEIK